MNFAGHGSIKKKLFVLHCNIFLEVNTLIFVSLQKTILKAMKRFNSVMVTGQAWNDTSSYLTNYLVR